MNNIIIIVSSSKREIERTWLSTKILSIPVEKGRPIAPVAENISVAPPLLMPAVAVSRRSGLEKISLPPDFKND